MSDKRTNGRRGSRPTSDGAYTITEILSQPRCWNRSLKKLLTDGTLEEIRQRSAGTREWIFVGCGSSYYVAQAAASTLRALVGVQACAFPASELTLFPDQVLSGRDTATAVLISRSGRTTEVLQAAELLRARGIPTVGIGCIPGQPLEQLVDSMILLLDADEQSTVMTRSFSTMLLALQAMAANLAGQEDFLRAQAGLGTAAEKIVSSLLRRVRLFVQRHDFADYVCLGQGALYGVACETALKLTEMSVSYAQSFHTLEFRHGPKSIVGPETLIVFLLSETGYEAECDMLQEVKKLGATTLVIADQVERRARLAADLLVEMKLGGPELARLPAYVVAGQLMGLYTGLQKGHDPDHPRHLSRVVELQVKKTGRKPAHATV